MVMEYAAALMLFMTSENMAIRSRMARAGMAAERAGRHSPPKKNGPRASRGPCLLQRCVSESNRQRLHLLGDDGHARRQRLSHIAGELDQCLAVAGRFLSQLVEAAREKLALQLKEFGRGLDGREALERGGRLLEALAA